MANKQKYRVLLSPGVYDDLNRHVYFLARVNLTAANQLKNTFLKDISSLQDMPPRHPLYERPWLMAEKYRHMISARRYQIVYTVQEDTVYVDAVLDCREG